MAYFVSQLIEGMTESVPDIDTFNNTSASETFRALAELYGMLHEFTTLDIESSTDKLILPLAVSALAYSDQRLQREGLSSFSLETAVINGATLAGNMNIIPLAHVNEMNVSWGKAMAAKGIDDHQPPKTEEDPDNSNAPTDESQPETDNSDAPTDESQPETDSSDTPVDGSRQEPASQNDGSNPATGKTTAAAAFVIIIALAAIALRKRH